MASTLRFIIVAATSRQGRIIVTIGVITALTARGMAVQGFRVGPDFIDLDYRALASGWVGCNLDPFLVGERRAAFLLAHSTRGAEIFVIEGMMDLFDEQLGTHGSGSATRVATLVDTPIVPCLDTPHTSCSVAAVALGLTQYSSTLNSAGMTINRVTPSGRHEEVLSALRGIRLPILGMLPRDAAIEAPSRRLGLVPMKERADTNAAMEWLTSQVSTHVDLDILVAAARSVPELDVTVRNPTAEVTPPDGYRPVITAADDRTFAFCYPETMELLGVADYRVRIFDPAAGDRLPEDAASIYLRGGFPEVHAVTLASRAGLRREIAGLVASGGPVMAEYAGMLYLFGNADATGMVGTIPGVATMGPYLTLEYRRATTTRDGFYARVGEEITRHEFRRATTQFPPGSEPGWEWGTPDGPRTGGWARGDMHASCLHVHQIRYP